MRRPLPVRALTHIITYPHAHTYTYTHSSLAADADIPVVFGLSGRRLGKCLGKSVRITVVGILSADGAMELFR